MPVAALLHSLEGPGGEISFLQWHPRGNALLAGASDGSAWLWAVERAEARFLQVFTCDSAVTCGSFSLSGKSVLTGCESGAVVSVAPAESCSAAPGELKRSWTKLTPCGRGGEKNREGGGVWEECGRGWREVMGRRERRDEGSVHAASVIAGWERGEER